MVRDIIPSQNVTWDDIRDTLNAGGGSVNNDVSSAFKESAKINMWSKHKPVRLAVNFCQDFDSSKPNYNPDWWRSVSYDCGLNPLRVSNYTLLPSHYDGNNNGWTYDLPTGSESQPLRLGDFAGYKKDALPPYAGFTVPNIVFKDQTKFKISARFSVVDGNSVGFNDIETTKNCYFGAYIMGKNLQLRATADSVGNPIISFPTSSLYLEEYTVYPFLCTKKYAVNDTEKDCSYYTVPNLSPVKFVVQQSSISISIQARAYTSERRVHYKVTAVNLLGDTKTLTNNWIYLRYANKDISDSLIANEKMVEIGNVQVTSGSTVIAEGDFENISTDLIENSKVWVSLNSGRYVRSVIPMKEITPIL